MDRKQALISCREPTKAATRKSEMLAIAMAVAVLCSGLNGILQVAKLALELGHGHLR